MIHCKKCGHNWKPLIPKPLKCPACNQPKYWMEKVRNVTGVKHEGGTNAGRRSEDGNRDDARERGRQDEPDAGGKLESLKRIVGRETDMAVLPEEEPVRTCRACEEPLGKVKGFSVCVNKACGMEGKVQ